MAASKNGPFQNCTQDWGAHRVLELYPLDFINILRMSLGLFRPIYNGADYGFDTFH